MSGTRILIPMPARDRMLRGINMSIVVGPLKDLSRERLVAALTELGQRGPSARIGYTYVDERTWSYDPATVPAVVEQMVSTFEPSTADRAAEAAVEAGQDNTGLPLRFAVSDDYFYVCYSHALGDAQAAYAQLDAIFTLLRGEETDWGYKVEDARPTYNAFRNFFDSFGKVRTAFQAKRYGQAHGETGALKNTHASGQLVYEILDADATRTLNAASRKVNTTIMAAMFDAVRRRLAENGIQQSSVVATYDLRRYLPNGAHAGGNLIAALPFSDTALQSAAGLAQEQENNSKTGLPLLASAFGVGKESTLGRNRPALIKPHYVPGHAARIVFSGLGVVRAIERLPWNTADGRLPFYVAYIHPTDANEIMINIIKVKNRLIISACFFPEVYSEAQVRAALQQVGANPTAFLSEDNAESPYYVAKVEAETATV